MKLQRREKILVSVALGLVGLAGLYFLFLAGDPRSEDQLNRERDDLNAKIAESKKTLEAASKDAIRLADWQQRALPDPEKAHSLYQNWLREMAVQAKVRDIHFDSSVVHAPRDQFTKSTYTLNAQAKLGELVQFLYEFYSAGYLHKISKLDVKTNRNSNNRDLTVVLTIEAISLPTADSKTGLPKKKEGASRLELPKLSDYRNPIVKRDMFATFVEGPAVISPPPKVDPANFTFITGFTEVDDQRKVWLQDRLKGKSWQLATGESFTVGNTKGTVQSISPNGEVIINLDGHRRLFHDGDNLRGGAIVPDQRPTKVDANADSDQSDPDDES
jgi:hypothetical protein